MNRRIVVILLTAVSAATVAQNHSLPDSKQLGVRETKPTPLQGYIPITNVHCDSSGNIFVPVVPSVTADARAATLYRITPDGQNVLAFSPPDAGAPVVPAQGISPDGQVVMLPQLGNKSVLVRFSPRGSMMARTELERTLFGHVGILPGGRVLVSARDNAHAFTVILDSNGKVVKSIDFPDDAEIERAIAQRDARYVNPRHPAQSNRAVDLGDVVSATDGYVYVLRYGDPAFIYAVNKDGDIVRRLRIQAPMAGMYPVNLQVTEKLIILALKQREEKRSAVLLIDKTSGAPVRLYDDTGMSGVFACYDGQNETLTNVTWADNKISLVVEVPK